MSPRDLVSRILLLSIVRFSLTSVIQPQSWLIVRISPEQATSNAENGQPESKMPQIEIQMMKGHVSPDEKWTVANEYKHLDKDYQYVCRRRRIFLRTSLSADNVF